MGTKHRRFLWIVVVAVPPLGSGCAERADVPAGTSAGMLVRDSAGIEIVENHEPAWGEGEGWWIDPEPVLQIGEVEGEEPYQFTVTYPVIRRPDGSIAAVENSTLEIRLFDDRGAFIRSIGRKGDGPGEFGTRPLLRGAPPDTLVVWDPTHRRLSRFLLDGTLLDERRIDPGADAMGFTGNSQISWWRLAPTGTMLASGVVSGGVTAMFERGIGALEVTTALRSVVLVSDGTPRAQVHPIGTFPDGESATGRVTGGIASASNPFAHRPTFVLDSDPEKVHLVPSGAAEVDRFSVDGSVDRIIRLPFPRLAVTDDVISRARDALGDRTEERGGDRGRALQAFDALTMPDSAPAIARLRSDERGTLFVRRWDFESDVAFDLNWSWDVIDPDGRWLGSMEFHPDLGEVFEIGDDYVLMGWRDDLNVAYIRLYRLMKGGGGP